MGRIRDKRGLEVKKEVYKEGNDRQYRILLGGKVGWELKEANVFDNHIMADFLRAISAEW